MEIERKEETSTFDVADGKITVIQVFRLYRDTCSAERGIFKKELESARFEADGEWFTLEMATELADMLFARGKIPNWLVWKKDL